MVPAIDGHGVPLSTPGEVGEGGRCAGERRRRPVEAHELSEPAPRQGDGGRVDDRAGPRARGVTLRQAPGEVQRPRGAEERDEPSVEAEDGQPRRLGEPLGAGRGEGQRERGER